MLRAEELSNSKSIWATALQLAYASRLAYEPVSRVEEALRTVAGFDELDVFEGDASGFAAATADVAVIAFAGTDSLVDWLSNLELHDAPWPPFGEAHFGFLAAAVSAQDRISAFVGRTAPRQIWLTGHSRGGAIAALSALPIAQETWFAGVHTFGQPKFARAEAAAAAAQLTGRKYVRFVNGEDIIARVPPGFEHFGLQVPLARDDFDSGATVTAINGAIDESAPLDPDAFAKLQGDLKGLRRQIEDVEDTALGEHTIEEALGASVEGVLPGFNAHRMSSYIAAISQQNRDLLSRRAFESDVVLVARRSAQLDFEQKTFESVGGSEETGGSGQPVARIPVLLRLRTSNWTPPQGVTIQSRIGSIVTATVAEDELGVLLEDTDVTSVEVSRDAGLPEVASAVTFIRANPICRPPISEMGDSALVGVIDTGCDIFHKSFRNEDGGLRILALWNQREKTDLSKTPAKLDPSFTQDYGRLYLRAELEALDQADVSVYSPLRDPAGHGTHVAAIAAGREVPNSVAAGIAPEAGIVVVIPDMRFEVNDPPSLGYSVSHVDALHFLRAVAEGGTIVQEEQQPMAVNVSLGMNAGAHDGTSTLEAAFDGVTGNGRAPGFVIVKSAGNERGHDGHVHVDIYQNGTETVRWHSDMVDRHNDYFEFWYSSLDSAQFILRDPNGNESQPISRGFNSYYQNFAGVIWSIELIDLHPDNGDSMLKVSIVRNTGAVIPYGEWQLEITGGTVITGTGVHGWVERERNRAVRFLNPEDDMTLSIPGTANSVITVGACGSQFPLVATSSSSRGWTRDGRQKPDVCAPGSQIVSAMAGTTTGAATKTGTSMAAPMVTGTLALIMSARCKTPKSQWNARQLQRALIQTTQNFSGVPHPTIGFGLIDAEKIFERLQ